MSHSNTRTFLLISLFLIALSAVLGPSVEKRYEDGRLRRRIRQGPSHAKRDLDREPGWGKRVAIAYPASPQVAESRLNNRRQERMKFKLVSLSQSLDYERRGREKRVPVVNAMSNSVRQSLLDAETAAKSRSRYRQLYLRNIHDREVDDFVARGGLGVVRAPVITPGVDDIDIALPANATPLAVTTTSFRDPTRVHSGVAAEFTRPETFGYVKSKDQVAGFVPHHVAALPESDASPSTERWKLVRLQLVSLMRFESPRVYDSSDLPRMDVLRRALHRAPNEFEARSLPKLAHDQDVIIKESSGQILMLGAIRARQDCLQCHSVVRGELLGAFSYEFIHSGDGEPT